MTLLDPLMPALARPWFDAVSIRVVTRAYMPLSRGWAAAASAEGDVHRFARDTGIPAPSWGLARAVRRVHRLHDRHQAAMDAWNDAFWGPEPLPAGQRADAERARRRAAATFMEARGVFLPWFRRLPPVAWTVPTPRDVEHRHGHRLDALDTAYAPPRGDPVTVSHVLEDDRTRSYWLRFRSPVLGDTVSAHVTEPRDATHAPTLIMLHGIAVEMEMWPRYPDPLETLLDRGVRIVRPDGPWHGRRRVAGFYGGEPIIAQAPEGMLVCLHAWAAEMAMLTDWARQRGSERVALGGVSLGALTTQMIATVSHSWAPAQRPDVAFLVATTGNTLDVVFAGSLAQGIGLPQRLEDAGWDRGTLERWLPLLQPQGPPVMGPGNVVMVLGDADDLTPYAGGLDLARRWSVPADNLFIRHQGHFSIALGLTPDPAPIERLGRLLQGTV